MSIFKPDTPPPHSPRAAPLAGPSTPPRPTPQEISEQINSPYRTRLLIILSFPVLFLLATPFWWYTTSIERLPLPVERISALENLPPPDVRSTILLTGSPGSYPAPPPDKAQYAVKDVCEAIGKEVVRGVDGIYAQGRTKGVRWWDLVYEAGRRNSPALRVHLTGSDRANTTFPLEPYVQSPEMGLGPGSGLGLSADIKPGTLVVPVHPSLISDRFLRLPACAVSLTDGAEHYKIAIINSLLGLYPSDPPEIPLRALKYSPNITLSFVLLNEDSADGSYVRSWDIEGAIRDHFLPHLEPLSPVFNFSIESQILYHAPLSFEPTYGPTLYTDDGQVARAIEAAQGGDQRAEEVAAALIDDRKGDEAWLIDEEMMKVFVNSERWSLDSAQSFLLPQFGAVSILNPPTSAPSSQAYHFPLSALSPSFHLFTQHLYSLLALPTYPAKVHPPPPANPLQPPSPLTPPLSRWQVETVLRQRMRENSDEARKTLAGISRLVKKIKEMKVGDGVRGKVLGAVEKLERLQTTSDPLEAFVLSRDAVALANQAFFDPSMMGLLYFPNEHKFAVYTPLFAPVAVPMIVGLLKEAIAWKRRQKGSGRRYRWWRRG
ncbi:hypothetical protein JCM24511_04844 [Saitozyma sp. JCM 24511]|nr:hypothetical protein JCM24511_04844 [Saitozyma sp. JCM 24511]